MTTQSIMFKRFNPDDIVLPKQTFHLPQTDNDEPLVIHDAIQLGHHSSKRSEHYKHPNFEFAPHGTRCSACRWFEVALFRTETDYVLWSCGHTIIPTENDRITIQRTPNEYRILEHMTVRKGETVFLPAPSAHVLADAAKVDEGILDAYVNRATP